MQFDMCHALAGADLWEPRLVLASVVWAALLAYMCVIPKKSRHLWGLLALGIVATPIAAGSLAGLVAFPSNGNCSVGYMGRGIWMAIPLATPFVALRLLQPRADLLAVAARAVAFLTYLHAWWTVTRFPNELAQEVGPTSLLGLDVKVAHAPWVALLGVAPMLLIYVVLERRAAPGSWRSWIAVRLQLLVATCALVAELRIASMSTVFVGEPEPLMVTPVLVLAMAFTGQAVLRHRQLSALTSIGRA